MDLKRYELQFSIKDGEDGEISEVVERVEIWGIDILGAVRNANSVLDKKENPHYVPYMPELTNSSGKTVATTNLEPPDNRRITYIAGSEVNSPEPWISLNKIVAATIKNRQQEWLRRFDKEVRMQSDHVYDLRFLAICRDIVKKINDDPSYEPPTYEEVMGRAPWGP